MSGRLFLSAIVVAALSGCAQAPGPSEEAPQAESDWIEFTILTTGGWVAFPAGGNWSVLKMQTKPPVTTTIFQIPNLADEGTPHSTNVNVNLFGPVSEESNAALARIGERFGNAQPEQNAFGEWTTFRQEATQAGVTYTILDARRDLADVVVGIRLSWPHLANNSPDYNEQMEGTFRFILQSIRGDVGRPEPREGGVWRRRDK